MATLMIGNAVIGTGRLTVTDVNGRIVHEQPFTSVDSMHRPQSGTASFPFGAYVASIDIEGRVSGMSFVIGE